MDEPVAPYDANEYPTTEGGSGGPRRRLHAPNAPLQPIGGGGARLRRPNNPRYPAGERPGVLPRRTAARTPLAPRSARLPDGQHDAHRTAAHGAGPAQERQRPHGAAALPPELKKVMDEAFGVLSSPVTGPVFGFAFGNIFPLGHHPKADGKTHTLNTQHQGIMRRGTIVSYNAGANTAVVRFGDTPDSPTASLPVSPMITSAVAGVATVAGVHLWNDYDPTDALVTAVL